VNSVIRTYLKNVKPDAKGAGGRESGGKLEKDAVIISEEGMKILLEKNGEEMSEILRKHDET